MCQKTKVHLSSSNFLQFWLLLETCSHEEEELKGLLRFSRFRFSVGSICCSLCANKALKNYAYILSKGNASPQAAQQAVCKGKTTVKEGGGYRLLSVSVFFCLPALDVLNLTTTVAF